MSEETSWCALTGSSGLLGRFQSYYHSSVLHLGIRSQFVLGLTWMFHTENMMVLLVGGMNWCKTIGSRVLWSVLSVCVWVFFFLFFVFFFFCFVFVFVLSTTDGTCAFVVGSIGVEDWGEWGPFRPWHPAIKACPWLLHQSKGLVKQRT